MCCLLKSEIFKRTQNDQKILNEFNVEQASVTNSFTIPVANLRKPLVF